MTAALSEYGSMGAAEKVLARMRNNPRDWHIEDPQAVAARFGFT